MGGFYQGLSDELSLWVKQAAWLSATPDGKEQSRNEAGDGPPPFPPNPAPYLTAWLFQIGPTSGEGPLTWQELAAWERLSGVELLPFEAQILRLLSVHYTNEKYLARKPDRPMPYNLERDEIAARRESVEGKITAMFGRN